MALHKLPKHYHPDFRLPRRKPTGKVELDKSNKYGKRIFAAWNFASREDWLLDYGSGKYAELIGDDQWLAVSDNNMNLRSVDNSSSERISVGSIDSSNPISLTNESTGGSYTIFFRCWTDDLSGNPTRIFDKSNGGGGANGWMIQSYAGSFDFYVGGSNEVSQTAAANEWLDCAITVKNGSAEFYVNNKAKTTGIAASTPTTTTNAAIANWNHTSDRQWKGDIAYIHMHYGAYSEQQVREYWRSPYQGFKPKNDPVYFTSDAGEGGVITIEGSFTLPSITSSASISASLPQPTIEGSFTLPSITSSASISASLPQPTIEGSFTLPSITSVGDIVINNSQPSLTGTFSFPLMTSSGAISATEPPLSIVAEFSLPTLKIAGLIVASGVKTAKEDKTHLNQSYTSNEINQSYTSNNINFT